MQIQATSKTTDDLLQAAGQLSIAELEKFVRQILSMQAHRKAPNLSKAESELLLKINQGITPETQQRYDDLIIKRKDETLTQEEHAELLELIDHTEKLNAKRIGYLSELATKRRTSLSTVLKDLNIPAPVYG